LAILQNCHLFTESIRQPLAVQSLIILFQSHYSFVSFCKRCQNISSAGLDMTPQYCTTDHLFICRLFCEFCYLGAFV